MQAVTEHERIPRRATRVLLAAVAGAILLLTAGTTAAGAATTSQNAPTSTCWKDVINDWLQHEPNVVGTYPIPCYTQAIQHLDSYADIQGYSNAPEDIRRALLAALHNQGNGGQGGQSNSSAPPSPSSGGSNSSGGSGGSGGSSSSGGGTSSGGAKSSGSTKSSATAAPETPAPNRNPVTRFFDSIGPGNAQSVPLPLLVLAGLAVLLLLAAAGTWIAKRIQSRRVNPAPAPARHE